MILKKHWRLFALLATLVLCLTGLCMHASAFDMTNVRPPFAAEKMVYGQSGAGRELVAYRFGNGENVLIAGFALHGYEDNFDEDGGALVYTADQLMKRLDENRNLLTDYGWTVYVLPCMNPDGLMDGYTCNGPGRCTTTYLDSNGKLVRGKGVDLNRSFPHNWTQYTNSRNFNGSKPLAAREAVALAEFVKKVKGSGANICIDAHGWFQQTLTSNGKDGRLFQIFASRFPNNTYANCTNSKGYFTSYTTSLGYASCLFEFPRNIYSMSGFLKSGYCDSFNACILDILKAYGSYNGHSQNCPSARFTDAVPWSWYHSALDYVIEKGIFNGVSQTSFAPNQAMTRAMFVTTLYRITDPALISAACSSMTETEFADVEPGAWYEEAVKWAAQCGIVIGYPDGRFGPSDSLTREQLAAILCRYAKWCGLDVSSGLSLEAFPDAPSVSAYAHDAICWAYGSGLIEGAAIGGKVVLLPGGTVTRAQAAVVIMRYEQDEQKNVLIKRAVMVEPNIAEDYGDLGGN